MRHEDPSLPTANSDLTVAERQVLRRIFMHPLSHNLTWREVFELFRAVGTVEYAHNGNAVLKLGGEHQSFVTSHDKSLAADDVMALRHLLTRAGWTPDTSPIPKVAEVAAGLAVVIDHAGARIYDLPFGNDHRKPHETHHVLHSINRKQHDADREENYPGDHRFFDAIAKDLLGAARIVILSHGTGQSNECDHLLDYMSKHHRTIHDRVANVVVADLSHTSVPQLLVLASQALQSELDSTKLDAT